MSTNKNEIQEKLKRRADRNLCPALTLMETKEEKELEGKGKEWGEKV